MHVKQDSPAVTARGCVNLEDNFRNYYTPLMQAIVCFPEVYFSNDLRLTVHQLTMLDCALRTFHTWLANGADCLELV
jgi:hypothetical protein